MKILKVTGIKRENDCMIFEVAACGGKITHVKIPLDFYSEGEIENLEQGDLKYLHKELLLTLDAQAESLAAEERQRWEDEI